MGDVAAGVALGLAVYEAVAVWFDKVPTITQLVNRTPAWVRWTGLAVAAAWALDHFKLWELAG